MSSQVITLFELPGQATMPNRFEAVLELAARLRDVKMETSNPNFEVFARRVGGHAANDGQAADWLFDPVEQGRQQRTAVWDLELPGEDSQRALLAVLKEARSTGLVALDEELGVAWLPDGSILPPSKADDWALYEDAVLEAAAKRPSRTQIKNAWIEKLTGLLSAHGFRDATDLIRGADFCVSRQMDDGQQILFGSIRTVQGEVGIELGCQCRNDMVRKIVTGALGPRAMEGDRVFFSPFSMLKCVQANGDFFPVQSVTDIQLAADFVATQVLEVLDSARTVAGMDRLLNGAQTRIGQRPETIASVARGRNFFPLVIAWMAGNPLFEEIAQDYRVAFANRPNGWSMAGVRYETADLETLLRYLSARRPDRA